MACWWYESVDDSESLELLEEVATNFSYYDKSSLF